MRTLATLALILATATAANARPHRDHKPRHESKWMRDCIHERTGPTDGITVAEARAICKAEQPEDEIAAARAQLALARLNAKVTKAQARIAKAQESCAQAVTDRCVELATPSTPTDCDIDADLRAEYELVCK